MGRGVLTSNNSHFFEEHERERESVCVCVHTCECIHVCVHVAGVDIQQLTFP